MRDRNKISIAVSSGKGGVGKTLTSIHLASAAARSGGRTLIIDGDLGLANVDVLLGIKAEKSIFEVLSGRLSIEETILRGPLGIDILPAGSGIAALQNLDRQLQVAMESKIQNVSVGYENVIIDTGAGISKTVIGLNRLARQNLVVTTPEPHAITDAYALIKVLSECEDIPLIALAVNNVRSEEEGRRIFNRLSEVVVKFLSAKLIYAGSVPYDQTIHHAVMARNAINDRSTHSIAGQAWTQCFHRLTGMHDLFADKVNSSISDLPFNRTVSMEGTQA